MVDYEPRIRSSGFQRSFLKLFFCVLCQIITIFCFFYSFDQIHLWRPRFGLLEFLISFFDNPFIAFALASYSVVTGAKILFPELPSPLQYTVVSTVFVGVSSPIVFMVLLGSEGSSRMAQAIPIILVVILWVTALTAFLFFKRSTPIKRWQRIIIVPLLIMLLFHFIPVQSYALSALNLEARENLAVLSFGEPYVRTKEFLLQCSSLEESVGKISLLYASSKGPFTNSTNKQGDYGGYFFEYVSEKGRGEIIASSGIKSYQTMEWRLNLGRVDLNRQTFLPDISCQ